MFKSDEKAEMIQFCFLPDDMDPANHPGLLEIGVCSFRLYLLLLSLLSRLLMLLHSPLQLILEEFLPILTAKFSISHIVTFYNLCKKVPVSQAPVKRIRY